MSESKSVGIVVIGRNEGERLARCLASVNEMPRRVYVDSGSSDGSVALARTLGVSVVELSRPPAFSAARARNAGVLQLLAEDPQLEFIQVVDGDCEVQRGWIEAALHTLSTQPGLAAVFGRRRERHPERSLFNALCDDEWNLPVGPATMFGGDVMFRVRALREVNLYNGAMIAGEEPELAMRLREKGWRLQRIDAEMTLHDANITRFSQWWLRMRRSGHAYGELALLHPGVQEPNCVSMTRRIVFWGGLLPVLLCVALVAAYWSDPVWWIIVAAILLLLSLNVVRLSRKQRRRQLGPKTAWASAFYLMLGKLPQFLGLLQYRRNRFLARASQLIEYKDDPRRN